MGSVRPREERRNIFLRARLRSEHGWADVTIGNVSSRGLMLHCTAPLQRNSFIEVRHRSVCIVGRVVWASGAKCGVRTQDSVAVGELLPDGPPKRGKPGEERRAAARAPEVRRRPAAETAEASRRFARAFDWTIIVLAAGAAGAFMTKTAWSVLDSPLAQVQATLAGNG